MAQENVDLLQDLLSSSLTTVWDEAHSHEAMNLRFDIPTPFGLYLRDQGI